MVNDKIMKEDKNRENEIKELIEHSGNNSHFEVVNLLRQEGWTVLISPYYNDNISDKPREIDIIAEKAFNVTGQGFGEIRDRILGTLNVKFFIECKYINKEIVFWFDEKNQEEAMKRIVKDTPLESGLIKIEQNSNVYHHHYLKNIPVAKLSASKIDKPQENEIIYKALNQSLNAMVYYKNTNSIIPIYKREKILKTVHYPIIVCKGFDKFYKVDLNGKGYSKIDQNFQLEVNYAYLDKEKNSQTEYFLIDIVDIDKVKLFLKDIEETDIKIICKKLSSEYSKRSFDEHLNNQRPQGRVY